MSYFVKRTMTKKGMYYQIYDGEHNKERGYTTQHSVKVIGYHYKLLEQGIEDPEAYAQSIAAKMRAEQKKEKEKKKTELISNEPLIKYGGTFLIDSVLNKMNIESTLNLFDFGSKAKYKLYDVFKYLIEAQIIDPSSKKYEYENFIPRLLNPPRLSYDNSLDALEKLGDDYASVIALMNEHLNEIYKRKYDHLYFDCTNYYFEIDRPFEDKQKGPSKENRKEPIVGMALLLDEDQIPLSMKIYPGNQSEKPYIRELIKEMKETHNISGKTIQVADKGLNCGQNIFEAIKEGDGYIYSQSVRRLSDKEQQWILLDNGYTETKEKDEVIFKVKECVDNFQYTFEYEGKKYNYPFKQKRVVYWSKKLAEKQRLEITNLIQKATNLVLSKAKKKEYGEAGKYIVFGSVDEDGVINTKDIQTVLNQEKIENDLRWCGYNMIVTSELNLKASKIYEIYHRLWRIEESFRILKTDLQARPVYLQKKETIYGHFLVCYTSLLILRIIELKLFKDEVPMDQIIRFIRNFQVVKTNNDYVNYTRSSDLFPGLIEITKLPLNKKYLSSKDMEKIQNYIFSTRN